MIHRVILELDTWQEAEAMLDRLEENGATVSIAGDDECSVMCEVNGSRAEIQRILEIVQ